MAKRCLHVGFNFADESRFELLKPIFDRAVDWVRYTPTNWLVVTSKEPAVWYRRIKPLLRDGDYVFVVEIDLDRRAGFLPRSLWEWIDQARTVGAG